MDETKKKEMVKELGKASLQFLETCIRIADKYEVDRDFLVKTAADSHKFACDVGTFKNFKFEEETA